MYQPPGSPQWLSCEAAATLFSKSLPEGVTLVYECSRRGGSRGKTLASTPTAAASTGVAKDHQVQSSRPKTMLGKSKHHATVIPGTQENPVIDGKNAQCEGEELDSSVQPTRKVLSSRSGILGVSKEAIRPKKLQSKRNRRNGRWPKMYPHKACHQLSTSRVCGNRKKSPLKSWILRLGHLLMLMRKQILKIKLFKKTHVEGIQLGKAGLTTN